MEENIIEYKGKKYRIAELAGDVGCGVGSSEETRQDAEAWTLYEIIMKLKRRGLISFETSIEHTPMGDNEVEHYTVLVLEDLNHWEETLRSLKCQDLFYRRVENG